MAGFSSVNEIALRLVNDEDIERKSVAHITSYELISSATGKPIADGLNDLRMGTTDHNSSCLSCNHGKKNCTGHPGHIVTKYALFQPIAIPIIRKWIKIICLNCGHLMLDKEKYKHFIETHKNISGRFNTLHNMSFDGKECPNCKYIHPKIVKDPIDHYTFTAAINTQGGVRNEIIYPDVLKKAFNAFPEYMATALGVPHPRTLVTNTITVPPNTVRPGMRSTITNSHYNDLTNLLQKIVKTNNQLPDLPAGMTIPPGMKREIVPESTITSSLFLQELWYSFINSNPVNVAQANVGRRSISMGHKATMGTITSIGGKEGIIREHLLGKRVKFMSRTTVAGDTAYKIDVIAIPLSFARTLQVREVVQEYNKDRLLAFFLNGTSQYPGCTYIIKKSNNEIHDVSSLKDFKLEIGDVLFRDLIDGDYVVFGRQPVLERSSIGVHKVAVIQDKSIMAIQYNVIACKLYGADFDGDQQPLWAPRHASAIVEAAILSSIRNSYISIKTSDPFNGLVEDSTIGIYDMSRKFIKMNRTNLMDLFSMVTIDIPKEQIYTGLEAISLLLKKYPINMKMKPLTFSSNYTPYISYDPDETQLVIENGVVVKGVLDKASVGGKQGSVFHLISRRYGSQVALDMLYMTQQMVLKFIDKRGITVSVADLMIPEHALKQIHKSTSEVLKESALISEQLLRREIVPPINMTVREFYEEMQINALRNDESEVLRWILTSINPVTNGLFRMISTGSKGEDPYMISIMAVIGQTTINGERMASNFSYGRTAPYFQRFAYEPGAKGFVENSYITGMTLHEYMFQAMAGRFDLITKALTTATTGHNMRKNIMTHQSEITDYYRRVVKNSSIVEFLYGDDGLDPRELESVTIQTIMMNNKELYDHCYGKIDSKSSDLVDLFYNQLKEDRDEYRKIQNDIVSMNFDLSFTNKVLLPVNSNRIVEEIINKGISGNAKGSLNVKIKFVNNFINNIQYVLLNQNYEKNERKVPKHIEYGSYLLRMSIRSELVPRVLDILTLQQIHMITTLIREKYTISLIDAGVAVGVIATQAISEPLTQKMLDSHKKSTATGGTSSSGLTRITELYSGKHTIKNPEKNTSMQIVLKEKYNNLALAQELATNIEYIKLENFVSNYDVLLESINLLQYPKTKSDSVWIKEFIDSSPQGKIPTDLTNWCFRFEINKSMLVLKSVDLELIVRQLMTQHPNTFVVSTVESVKNIYIRMWIRSGQFKTGFDEVKIKTFFQECMETSIRGIPGIYKCTVKKVDTNNIGEDGSMTKYTNYTIHTDGSNLFGVMALKMVDTTQTISSSLGDTHRIFGIEAARTKLISETRSFMKNAAPNMRHLNLFADEMTRLGNISNINRAGLDQREKSNILLRMSYSAPKQIITNVVGTINKSPIYGIAAPELLGAIPKIGSAYSEYIIDEEYVKANTKTVASYLDDL